LAHQQLQPFPSPDLHQRYTHRSTRVLEESHHIIDNIPVHRYKSKKRLIRWLWQASILYAMLFLLLCGQPVALLLVDLGIANPHLLFLRHRSQVGDR